MTHDRDMEDGQQLDQYRIHFFSPFASGDESSVEDTFLYIFWRCDNQPGLEPLTFEVTVKDPFIVIVSIISQPELISSTSGGGKG